MVTHILKNEECNVITYKTDFPGTTSEIRGVCITSDGTWLDEAHKTKRRYLCESNCKCDTIVNP